jgi:hypothetical protein
LLRQIFFHADCEVLNCHVSILSFCRGFVKGFLEKTSPKKFLKNFISTLDKAPHLPHNRSMKTTTPQSKENILGNSGTITAEAANAELARLADLYAPRGSRINHKTWGGGVSISCERSWGVGCDLHAELGHGAILECSDGILQRCEVKVTLSWSSTQRTIATAVASIQLYSEMTAVAALIESRMGEFKIYETGE